MPTATWSNEPTSAVTSTLTLRVTFDEPISGFTAGDIRLRRTSDNRFYSPTAAQTTLTHLGSNVWEVEIADLVSLLGDQNGEFYVRLRWHTVFFETSQQTGPSAAVDSARFTIHTTAPFGVISAFAHQRVTIGTEMALDINITGNPDHAYIEGLLEGFYTNWKDPTLQVRGAATRLLNNMPFTVKALKATKEPLTRTGILSVVPAAPVITNPGRQKFVRGLENAFIVNIANSPSRVRAVGPWVGMRYGSHPDGGIRIFGIVPEVSHAIPGADQKIRVTAESGALMDEVEIDFDLLNMNIYVGINSDDIHRIQLNDTDKSISSDLSFDTDHSEIRYLASDADYIYYGTISSGGTDKRKRFYRVPRSTGNGQSVNATLVHTFVNTASGIVIDGNDGYRLEHPSGNKQIRVFNKSTGATIRTFRLNFSVGGNGIAIDGDDLIVLVSFSSTNHRLRWYNKKTANGQTASHTKEISLRSFNLIAYNDLAVFRRTLFITMLDRSGRDDNKITTIDIDTGAVIQTYSVPSSFFASNSHRMYGITVEVG